MVNIYGKTDDKKSQFLKVAEIEDSLIVFPELSFEEPQIFSGKWKKDDEEIYYIDLSEDLDIINEYIDVIASSTDVNVVDKQNFPNLHVIFVEGKDNSIKFQRIYNKYFFKKCFLTFPDSSVCQINNNQEIITLTGKVDAYWNNNEKRLYFESFMIAKTIFPKINKFYREATESDIENFSNINILQVKKVDYGSRARKKIAQMLDDDVFKDKTLEDLKEYAERYEQGFPEVENGKIKLENNKDIELIYDIVNQLFYTTDLTGEKRKTNSSKPIITETSR